MGWSKATAHTWSVNATVPCSTFLLLTSTNTVPIASIQISVGLYTEGCGFSVLRESVFTARRHWIATPFQGSIGSSLPAKAASTVKLWYASSSTGLVVVARAKHRAQTIDEVQRQYHFSPATIFASHNIRGNKAPWVLRVDVEALALQLYRTREFHDAHPEQFDKPCLICAITTFTNQSDVNKQAIRSHPALLEERQRRAQCDHDSGL